MKKTNAQIIRILVPLVLLVLLFAAAGYYYWSPQQKLTASKSPAAVQHQLDHIWPPEIGQEFPNLYLHTNKGGRHRLSEFRGKVIIIEPVGMTCPACNAFNGGNQIGGYQGVKPQQGVSSLKEMLKGQGVDISDPRLTIVNLLLYNMQMQAPTQEDVSTWAEHFGWKDHNNVYVMAGDKRYINKASYTMIPGFYLIDKDFILRSDATGHNPKHGIGNHLLPLLPKLLKQANNARSEPDALDQQMTVATAYQAIPHRRTGFDHRKSTISRQAAEKLHAIFNWTDKAVIERVETLQAVFGNNRDRYRLYNYQIIIDALQNMKLPGNIQQAHTLITEAVREQQIYFEQLHSSIGKMHFNSGDPLIQSSHKKLLNAYNQLMRQFPNESAENRQAFFDHLCALDFI